MLPSRIVIHIQIQWRWAAASHACHMWLAHASGIQAETGPPPAQTVLLNISSSCWSILWLVSSAEASACLQMDTIAEDLDDAASIRSSRRGPIGATMSRIATMQRSATFARFAPAMFFGRCPGFHCSAGLPATEQVQSTAPLPGV